MTPNQRNTTPEEATAFKSISAVAYGFVFISAITFAADTIVKRTVPGAFATSGRTDNLPVLLFSLLYIAMFGIVGSYLTARLAPRNPMKHALILGWLALFFSFVATITLWDSAPAWYHVAALMLIVPCAWLGARLREIELKRGSELHFSTMSEVVSLH
jgi:hypothetical protein